MVLLCILSKWSTYPPKYQGFSFSRVIFCWQILWDSKSVSVSFSVIFDRTWFCKTYTQVWIERRDTFGTLFLLSKTVGMYSSKTCISVHTRTCGSNRPKQNQMLKVNLQFFGKLLESGLAPLAKSFSLKRNYINHPRSVS